MSTLLEQCTLYGYHVVSYTPPPHLTTISTTPGGDPAGDGEAVACLAHALEGAEGRAAAGQGAAGGGRLQAEEPTGGQEGSRRPSCAVRLFE